VSNNGLISFNEAFNSFTPNLFPLPTPHTIIAPFWTDLDNRVSGIVSYRESNDPQLLQRATQDINRYYHFLDFNATWVFVATWDKVPYFSSPETKNTFQAVLITNGNNSFVIMNYGYIDVTTRNVVVKTLYLIPQSILMCWSTKYRHIKKHNMVLM
ncbi:SNED1 protein, partial [Polyodon spathula]|nr:SNED1 protein [Polyodon spathula]MBN3288050.1 SNED1 protein [Polyodon spathula]